jgi:hypothetical protein
MFDMVGRSERVAFFMPRFCARGYFLRWFGRQLRGTIGGMASPVRINQQRVRFTRCKQIAFTPLT